MITPKFVTLFGWTSLGLMICLLILLWLRVVPQQYYVPSFILATVLFAFRIYLRLKLHKMNKLAAAVHQASMKSDLTQEKP